MPPKTLAPSRATVMIKPVGALCNLDCHYCYYLPTKSLWGGREHRMRLEVLESVFASVLPRFGNDVTIAWQGGEPTLAGLDFFREAIAFQEKHRRPEQRVSHALQTNGTLLNEDWCTFLRENNFLIGLSLDGPAMLHDHYRLDGKGRGSAQKVIDAWALLRRHKVQHNILSVLNDLTVEHPDEVYRFLINNGCDWLQFVPAIEWEPDPSPEDPHARKLAPFSPTGEAYGRFLCRVFDQWFEKHRHKVSVRLFDTVLSKLVTKMTPLCIMDASCHNQLTIEHDGSVFGCDHFVERRWQLGQIGEETWANEHLGEPGEQAPVEPGTVQLTIGASKENEASKDDQEPHEELADVDAQWYDRMDSDLLGEFAARKQSLPESCTSCQWLKFCYGGCPKHRSHGGDVPEASTLCAGYQAFFEHAMPRMEWLASYFRQGVAPPPPDPKAARKRTETARPVVKQRKAKKRK